MTDDLKTCLRANDDWQTFHLYHTYIGLRCDKIHITKADKVTTAYIARHRYGTLLTGKPKVELRRADDSLVGAVSRVRSFWSPKVDSYVSSGSECISATSKFSTNAKLKKFIYRDAHLAWQHTSCKECRLMDDLGRVFAVLRLTHRLEWNNPVLTSRPLVKKVASLQIKDDVEECMTDFIVLNAFNVAKLALW